MWGVIIRYVIDRTYVLRFCACEVVLSSIFLRSILLSGEIALSLSLASFLCSFYAGCRRANLSQRREILGDGDGWRVSAECISGTIYSRSFSSSSRFPMHTPTLPHLQTISFLSPFSFMYFLILLL